MRMLKLSNFLQVKFNIFLYTFLEWNVIRLYIYFLCKLYFFFNKNERNSIKKAVNDVIGWLKSEKDLSNITKKVFSGIFYHYYEKIHIAFSRKKKLADFLNHHVVYKDVSVIEKALSKGKGVILITGHYGAIEYIPILLGMINIDISMIAKFKTPQIRKRDLKQASNFGIQMIDADNRGTTFHKAVKELKHNRVLITQCDEIDEWRTSDKKKMTFLGKVTGLDRTVNLLHRRTGAEVVFGIMYRFNLKQYKFVAYSHEKMKSMIKNTSTSTVGEVVLKVLEQLIYKYPEQWYEWKKYPKIASTHGFSDLGEKYQVVPYLQPAFNISL